MSNIDNLNILESVNKSADANEIYIIFPHISMIFLKQSIHSLTKFYLNTLNNSRLKRKDEILPSIDRFHGILLFVDISGFTALSQNMSVELLQKHINNYFTRIIDIINIYGGEIVKFAGDALYVVWQSTLVNPLNYFDRGILFLLHRKALNNIIYCIRYGIRY